MITHDFDLDMVPGGVPLIVPLSQYDSAFSLVFHLFASAGDFTVPAGATAVIRGTKTDGKGYSVDAAVDPETRTVTVAGDVQLTAAAGVNRFELTLYRDEKELNTANFILAVERAPLDRDTEPSDSKIRELYDVEDNADEIIAAGKQYETWRAEMSQLEEDTLRALEKATNAENEVAETQNGIDQLKQTDTTMQLLLEGKVDGGYTDNNGYLILTSNGEPVGDPIGPFAGGGGGGSSTNNAVLTVENTTGWLSKTIADGAACIVKIRWSSIEDDMPTGNGTMRITVNGVVRATLEIAQGDVTTDISKYLSTGSNVVKVQVADVYGNARTINFSVTTVALSLSSTFDTTAPFTGAISFPYTPVGAVSKTVHFILDGTEIGTQQTSVSGRQMSYTIPAQSHGGHTLGVYFDADINGSLVQSNELYYEFIAIEQGNNTVIIVSSFNQSVVSQYTSLQIPYTVYDPTSLTAEVTLKANGTRVSKQTVDRTEQSYTYRANDVGTLAFEITSGTAKKTFRITVEETEIHVEAETEALKLYLTSQGRSNNEESPGTWAYGSIQATLSGFNFTSDGWQSDEEGTTVLRVAGNARVSIPYQVFGTDFRGTGKTIELEFATRDVMNYDSVILSCMSSGRGISLTAQKALLASEQSQISTQYKENEHVRISFVVEKRSENRLIYCYINGIMSGAVQYPQNDDFSQGEAVGISIGSNDCTIDLYCIRVYDNNLTRHQVLDNWIADSQLGSEMLDRYTHNAVYDAYGNVVISQLPSDLPYLIIECQELPQYKGDKKTVSGSYVDPMYPSKSFTFTGAVANVQGTSSQYYARKNYKISFKGGFQMQSGTRSSTYAINSNAVPTDTFTFKADVASSEGANNVELARLYNDACPYKTPAQVSNSKVRQGIDGFPIVIFWSDGENTMFLGKYNFNNDKGTEEVFGFATGDESWEIKNNTSDRVLWRSADYTSTTTDEDGNVIPAWLNDFEARYPDTDPAYTDPAQLQEFAAWVVSTDRAQATDVALDSPITYDGVEYTADTAEYRLAKFKAEAGNYMEMQSALFYYIFTELFLMVDSRAKNAFPSFIGASLEASE